MNETNMNGILDGGFVRMIERELSSATTYNNSSIERHRDTYTINVDIPVVRCSVDISPQHSASPYAISMQTYLGVLFRKSNMASKINNLSVLDKISRAVELAAWDVEEDDLMDEGCECDWDGFVELDEPEERGEYTLFYRSNPKYISGLNELSREVERHCKSIRVIGDSLRSKPNDKCE